MENSIINKIKEIISEKENDNENIVSLTEIINLFNNINIDKNNRIKEITKKINNKLSNSFNFFNYEVKEIDVSDNIVLIVNYELSTKKIEISKTDFEVLSDIKNKNAFQKNVAEPLKSMMEYMDKFKDYDNIQIKTKYKDINININSKEIEINMYKSPNWITMGKAFSLYYQVNNKSFNYQLDHINLKETINSKENELFSHIYIKKNLLSNDLQNRYEYYYNHKLEANNSNSIKKFLKKLSKLFKKQTNML